ncbi:nucleotidyltransferase family protein [Pelotalea chapellei]|uniref:Nucleotidyltransferase domain-containing protein n=1 Tax=Pelotalea chapellei TaxID=44671 RepID=A0ABS5UAW8_9BACT|nr:nucleotidyltransferase domain-containing protein [Pelotalea chapellei]MBT1072810.1 nucleotidyltransferase domain-containing protein [Pelotalea chapellei]
MLDLTPHHLTEVRRILLLHVPGRRVCAFGSRVQGNAKPFSDLDLVVMGEVPLDFRQLAVLKDAFTESNLPFRVDVIDWASTSDTFRRIIEGAFEVVAGE